jgi:hypothetical protein
MALQVATNDASALTDTDLDELASLEGAFDIGALSKAKEEWVLATTARIDDKLHGFTFSTLERIGGTPCVLIGMASIRRNAKRETVLRSLLTDQMHRAVLAFPDEDVLGAARFGEAGGFDAFRALEDIVPRPGHRANGEERAWGGRLAKRYGVDVQAYDKRAFRVNGDGSGPAEVFDYSSLKPEEIAEELNEHFDGLHPGKGDCLIAFGWAMEEDLRKLA